MDELCIEGKHVGRYIMMLKFAKSSYNIDCHHINMEKYT
jgi:hypothetical protein